MDNRDIIKNLKFNYWQMNQIRLGLRDGLDVSKYANPKLDSLQMDQIRLGLRDGLDVSIYADPKFNHSKMRKIRQGLREIREEILEGRDLEDIKF